MKMKRLKASIIIVSWNGKNLLRKCLRSLRKNTDPSYKVIIVDNGSTDGSKKMIKKEFSWVDMVSLNKNYGFTKGTNIGIKRALKKYNVDYILLMNNDIEIIQKNWLKNMINVLDSYPKGGIAPCKLLSKKKKQQISAAHFVPIGKAPEISAKETVEVDWAIGTAFLIKKNVIKKIGLFDEKFSPAYGEESDYCWRARKKGYKILYNPFVSIIHYGAATAKKLDSDYLYFIKERNRVRNILLNYPTLWLIIRFIVEIKNIIKALFISRIRLLMKAYQTNKKNLKEILEKRKRRTVKIWSKF